VPITLSEEDGVRFLHFGSPWVQGAMRIARHDELVLEYVRQMMGWLLFLEPPARILQLGLGAGALTRFSLRHCPVSEVTAVELSEEVIETARQWFALPRSHPRLRVVRSDAQEFVERPAAHGRYGVIQVDLYDMHARGPVIESLRFYRACREALAEPGVCVVNLFGEHASFERNRRQGAGAAPDRGGEPGGVRVRRADAGGALVDAGGTRAPVAQAACVAGRGLGQRVACAIGPRPEHGRLTCRSRRGIYWNATSRARASRAPAPGWSPGTSGSASAA